MNQTAVICSDDSAVGVARYVREARAGILVRPGDVKALSDAMTCVVQNPREWKQRGERGRGAYEKYFPLPTLECRVNELVEKLELS